MVRPLGEKYGTRCSNENMENGSGKSPKYRNTETEVSDVIRNDMKEKVVNIEEAQDWRLKIRVHDPNNGKGRIRRSIRKRSAVLRMSVMNQYGML